MSERQMGLTVFAGMAAPMALLCGATAWPAVLLGESAALLGIVLSKGDRMYLRWMRYAYLLWCVFLMAKCAAMSRSCFQDETAFIPIVLLSLAAVAERKQMSDGKLGTLLCPAIIGLLFGLLVFASSDFRWSRLASTRGNAEAWLPVAGLALSPLVLGFTKGKQQGLQWGCIAACIFGTLVSVVCSGVLGNMQGELRIPLYDIARGVSILGVAERLESLLSVALCMGFFVALCSLCSVGVSLISEVDRNKKVEWWIVFSAFALSSVINSLPAWIWFGLAVVFGVIIPVLTKKRTFEKNRAFFKNNA